MEKVTWVFLEVKVLFTSVHCVLSDCSFHQPRQFNGRVYTVVKQLLLP